MKLTELDARFIDAGGRGITTTAGDPVPHRRGVGLGFDCPCGCPNRRYVDFTNPIDGGPPVDDRDHTWQRTGETIETLTLHPSIKMAKDSGGCGWHGWIKNGEANGRVES